MESKALFRKELLKKRKELIAPELKLSDLDTFTEFKNSKVIFCYVSAHGEVGTHTLIAELLKGKEVVVPYCTDKQGNMICVKINSASDLTEGSFGILEPKNPIEFPKGKIDFAIVPGIAFDKEGYRLGYGKGYYDRFLCDISPYKLGVCKKEFFIDSLPHNEYDIQMNNIMVL